MKHFLLLVCLLSITFNSYSRVVKSVTLVTSSFGIITCAAVPPEMFDQWLDCDTIVANDSVLINRLACVIEMMPVSKANNNRIDVRGKITIEFMDEETWNGYFDWFYLKTRDCDKLYDLTNDAKEILDTIGVRYKKRPVFDM